MRPASVATSTTSAPWPSSVWIAALVLAAVSLRQAIRVDAARAFRRPSSKLKRPLMRLQPSEPLKVPAALSKLSSGYGLGISLPAT